MRKTIKVNNEIFDWEENLTITKLLKKKRFTFKMLIVKIDGKLIKKDKYQTTVVPSDADVQILHLISGG